MSDFQLEAMVLYYRVLLIAVSAVGLVSAAMLVVALMKLRAFRRRASVLRHLQSIL